MAGIDGNIVSHFWKRVLTVTSGGSTRTLTKAGRLEGRCWNSTDDPEVPHLGVGGDLIRATVKVVRQGDAFDVYWQAPGAGYELIAPDHGDASCAATVCLPGIGDTVDWGYSGHANGERGTPARGFLMNIKRVSGAIEDAFNDERLVVDREPPFECAADSGFAWCLENGDDASFFEGTGGNLRIALTPAKSELRTRFFTAPNLELETLGETGDPSFTGTIFDVETDMRAMRTERETGGLYLIARKPDDNAWVGVRFWQAEGGPHVSSLKNTAAKLETIEEAELDVQTISARIRRDHETFHYYYRSKGESCWTGLGTAHLGTEIGGEVSFHLAARGGDLVADFDRLRRTLDTTVCP